MAEIVPVVSEALEAQVRNLLPSQRGFGQDLQASNVITPIIDLTPAAEGTTTPELLQTALAYGSQTSFALGNVTGSTLANTAGFWRFYGVGHLKASTSGQAVQMQLTRPLVADKEIYRLNNFSISDNELITVPFDFVVFLQSGDTVAATVSIEGILTGSYRQIADVNGNLVNPSGFTPQ